MDETRASDDVPIDIAAARRWPGRWLPWLRCTTASTLSMIPAPFSRRVDRN